MKRSRFVIVGVGHVGLDLLGRISRECDLIVVERNPEAAEAARKLWGDDLRVVIGDATSRLVLLDAGVADADAVILTPTTQLVTLEVARVLADHFLARRVMAVGITPQGTEELEALGVEVDNLFRLGAVALRNRLERRTRAAHGIGLDQNEILEVEVHPHSRLAHKPLRRLAPQRWNVGVVYRDGNILVPHGDTTLRGGDRVVLLGDPRVVHTVAEMLTFSFQQFPLEYGATLTAYLFGDEGDAFFAEVSYLAATFPLERVVLLLSPRAQADRAEIDRRCDGAGLGPRELRDAPGAPLAALAAALGAGGDDRGLVVLARAPVLGSRRPFAFDLRRNRFLLALSRAAASPILLAAGTFPYARVAVPGIPGVDLQHVLETTFELGSSLRQETAALFVEPSRHLSTDRDDQAFAEMRKTVSDLGLLYKASVETRVLAGNPVLAVTDALAGFQLLVADTGGWKKPGWLRSALDPDPVWHLVRRSPVSTLLLPPGEEAL